LKKDANLKNGAACTQLGLRYAAGSAGEVDLSKAKAYYDRACRLESEQGCREAARLKALGY